MPIGVAVVLSVVPGLDRPVVVEVLLTVKDRAEQLARDDLHRRHPGGLEGGDDREHGRCEFAGRVGRNRVVCRGRVGGETLLGDLELNGIAGGADRVGLEGGGCLGIAHVAQPNKPDTLFCIFAPALPEERKDQMSKRTFVIGVGMTKFDKPGTKEGDYPDWAKEAGEKALADAGIPYTDVEQAYAGYCYGDSTYGQRALYQLGLTGIPVVNVNNNCSTGSSALFLARQAVRGGLVDCALAIGFEKMEPGSLGVKYTDRTNALDKHAMAMFALRDPEESPGAPQMFGNAGRDHMDKYGSDPRSLRVDRLEEPQALGQQPLRAVSDRVLAGRDQGCPDDPLAADEAAVLADLRRLGLRDRRVGELRRLARPVGSGG